ncbi:unnamed protein product [Adineta steineri]|uniref:Uncharacterized protein n=1 Tax=Adineta steineri TaxID=433720 RepID=A0A818Y1L3_9BILA|nr:unnamed protein product [Adineta steineri]CAF3748231.1 unnamed protein product [Adineta steineri]
MSHNDVILHYLYTNNDPRIVVSYAFQALGAFCELIESAINNSLIQFNSQQYITASVTPSELFQSQAQSFIDQFKLSTTNNFLLSLNMIRKTTQGNAFLSGQLTNYYLTLINGSVSSTSISYSNCNCHLSNTCVNQLSFYKNNSGNVTLFDVPGFYIGCYVIEALLQSTLQCFYDKICIDHLQVYLTTASPMNVTALDSSLPSQYSEDSTIKNLLNELMIEEWSSTQLYDRYYDECQPIECTYNVKTRNNVIYIVTTMFGIIGGLITVLKLVVPRVVKFIRKKRSRLSLANVVPTVPPSTDEHKLKNQKISTRLNVLLLILSLTILLLYTFLSNVTMTINVPTPTLAKYEQLYSKYSQTLTCPCKHISINYEKFLHIEYSLHQVCTSVFITDEWISYLVISNKTTSANINFRRTGSNAFQALRAFCELVESTINNSLIQFNSSQYITASVASPELFQSQAQSFINQFISSTTNTFVLSLNTIRNSTHGDSLVSGLLTNYLITIGTSVSNEAIVLTSPVGYSTCNCVLSSRCIAQSSVLSSLVNMGYFYIPGFYTGCYVIEALLQSTLECFYDQNCIDQLQLYLTSASSMNVTALNLSLPSQYSEDLTIENLLNNLMVEEWYSTQFYDRYYDECQPIECTYTIKTRNNVIYITTTMFGIIGGLITILSCIVPQVVKFVRKKKELTQPLIENVTTTVNIATPTVTKYEQLYSKYSQTLTCPCQHISINYEKFLSIEYTLHQVCTSFFITNDWISYISNTYHTTYYVTGDFRITGPYQFEALRAFCELIDSMMSNSLIQFNSQQYITVSVTPSELFQLQTQSFIDQFKLSTTNTFLLSLNMIRKTIQGNVLLSGRQTNYQLHKVNDSILRTTSRVYDNCICSLSNTCIDNSSLFNGYGNLRVFNVTGFYVGCYTTEALLQSTLECFYNQTCIDTLQIYLSSVSPMYVTALDPLLPSQYFENSAIEYLLNNLMIEEWNSTQMYDQYYNECQPMKCTYTIETRNNILYVITILIGLIGGLTTVSKIFVPILVKIIVYCFRKWRNRVVPQISIIET